LVGGYDGHAHTLGLDGLDQTAEVTITREQHHFVEMGGQLHHVDGDFDIHIALGARVALGIGKAANRLGVHGEAVVVQPIDQRTDRRELLALDNGRVIIGADQTAFAAEKFRQFAEVQIDVEGARGRIKVCTVNKECNAIAGRHELCVPIRFLSDGYAKQTRRK